MHTHNTTRSMDIQCVSEQGYVYIAYHISKFYVDSHCWWAISVDIIQYPESSDYITVHITVRCVSQHHRGECNDFK